MPRATKLGGYAIEQHDSPNKGSSMSGHRGVVLHIAEGTYRGTISWQLNPNQRYASGQSVTTCSTWIVGRAEGEWAQMVDSNRIAWCQRDGSRTWLSIELAGYAPAAPTAWQIEACAQLLVWAHRTHGIPIAIADHPDERGLGHHSMDRESWGEEWGHDSCLPLDTTEVLTPAGWVHLSEVTRETLVASMSVDSGILRFAQPVGIVEPYDADLISVSGFEMTPDHRLYVRQPNRPYKVVEAGDLREFRPWPAKPRTNLRMPAFGAISGPGIGVGPDLMRLLVWAQADGHYQMKDGRLDHLHFHLRKPRKVQRIKAVLSLLGREFSESRRNDGTTVIKVYGVGWLRENVLRWMPDKQWGPWLLDADGAEFAALDEEIVHADGHQAKRQNQRTYHTAQRVNADWVQALYVTHGRSASVYPTPAGWVVNLHTRRGNGHSITCEDARRGVRVGCLTTVDDTLLIRQHGRVAIVGNCPGSGVVAAKSAIVKRAGEILAGGETVLMALTDAEQTELLKNVRALVGRDESRIAGKTTALTTWAADPKGVQQLLDVQALMEVRANLATLAGRDWVDEAAIVDGVLAGLGGKDLDEAAAALRAAFGPERAAELGALLAGTGSA